MGSRIIGTWNWDLRTNLLCLDKVCASFYDISADEAAEGINVAQTIECLHDQDRDRVEALVRSTVAKSANHAVTFRARRPEGGYRWIFARGECQRDRKGQPIWFPGINVDLGQALLARETGVQAADVVADLLGATRDATLELNDPFLTHIVDIAMLQLATGPSRPLPH